MRVAANASNRILFRGGLPIFALVAGKVVALAEEKAAAHPSVAATLRRRRIPAQLRGYY